MTDKIILGLTADGEEVHIEVKKPYWQDPAYYDTAVLRQQLMTGLMFRERNGGNHG